MKAAIPTITRPATPVRIAVDEDINEIMEMGRELHAENGRLTLNEQKIYDVAMTAIRGDGAIMAVVGPIGRLEGMVCLTMAQFWYTDEYHLEEMFNYVRPQYRRSENAKNLIKFSERLADKTNKYLMMGVFSDQRTMAKLRLYERQLGTPAGAVFWRAPKG
jgi:GNAT superfamily N-acetyltransferase